MRTRTAVLLTLMAALLLVCMASPAADVPSLADSYKTAGGACFSSQLVPIPFGVHALQHDVFPDTTGNTNDCRSHADGYVERSAPAARS